MNEKLNLYQDYLWTPSADTQGVYLRGFHNWFQGFKKFYKVLKITSIARWVRVKIDEYPIVLS